MKVFKCPICLKIDAYEPKYGVPGTVVCKCNGLTEVGLISKGVYSPYSFKTENVNKNFSNIGIFEFRGYNILRLDNLIDVELFSNNSQCDGAEFAFQSKATNSNFFACIDTIDPKNTFFFISDSGHNIKDIGFSHRVPLVSFIKEIIEFINAKQN
jgi:hypothetical protein